MKIILEPFAQTIRIVHISDRGDIEILGRALMIDDIYHFKANPECRAFSASVLGGIIEQLKILNDGSTERESILATED